MTRHRADITAELIHWIKGDTCVQAFDVLQKIVSEQRLIGGNGHIKGEYQCVCFTEAPKRKFHQILTKYKPFGIQISKNWAYDQGGRPVIYQSDVEFDVLPDDIKWRHVRYEPTSNPPIDFTWEREWRIKTDEISIPPDQVRLILPNESYVQSLINTHRDNEECRIEFYAVVYGNEWKSDEPDPFRYPCATLNL